MDIDALEKLLQERASNPSEGAIKLVHTIPVHHNPTGVTMCNAKRERLVQLACEYNFHIVADEAYQLLGFGPSPVVPLYYHDSVDDPRVYSLGTFSKLIGPGVKVGWIQAHPKLLAPITEMGVFQSGNNPVTFSSVCIADFVRSGALKEQIQYVSSELERKCRLLVQELKEAGLEPFEPTGGYFVWVKRRGEDGKMTGRNGVGMSLERDRYKHYMRLCFAWLGDAQIASGARYLRE